MRARVVLLITGVLLLAVPVSSAAASKVSLRTNKRLVVSKDQAQLSGRLASGNKNVVIFLRADRFPYNRSKTIAKTATNSRGRFGFQVRPKLGTKYRVVLKRDRAVHSPLVRVFVTALTVQKCSLCGDNAPTTSGPHTLKARLKITYPNHSIAKREVGKSAFFYYGQRDGGGTPERLRLRKTNKLKRIDRRRDRASFRYQVEIPASTYSLKIAMCVRATPRSTGLGLPGDHRCGDKRIPYDYGYLGRSSSSAPTTAKRLP